MIMGHLLLVFVIPFSFVLCYSVSHMNNIPLQSSKNIFQLLFGFDKSAELSANYNTLHKYLPDIAHESVRGSQHYALCTTIKGKSRASQVLSEINHHPVYVSAKLDIVCYIAMLAPADLETDLFSSKSSLQSADLESDSFSSKSSLRPFFVVERLRDFLRIHRSTLDYAASIYSADHTASSGNQETADKRIVDVEHLEVFRGLGVYHHQRHTSETTEDILRTVKHRLNNNDHGSLFCSGQLSSSLAQMESADLVADIPWLPLWKATAWLLHDHSSHSDNDKYRDLSAHCGFGHLSMKSSRQGIRIHGMEAIVRGECVVILALHLLRSSPDAISVVASPKLKFANNFARAVTQVGVSALTGSPGSYSLVPGSKPFTDRGLNGYGQIVSVGDSGLDELMCFFSNGDGTVIRRSNTTNPYTDLTRRKVVQYIAYQDGGDWMYGHGTHVTGSVAGASIDPEDPESLYNGMATGAKIAFFDMSIDDGTYSAKIPDDFYNEYFGALATSGERINTNSWGNTINYYDSIALQTDEYVYDNPEQLVLFAAQNTGERGYGTIGTPAVAKNVLAVGAANSGHGNTTLPDVVAYFSAMGPSFDGRIKPDICA